MNSLTRIVAPIVRRNLSTSSQPRAKQLMPEIQVKFEKLKKNQEFFQREDGKWVFQKKPGDNVLLSFIILSTIIGFGYSQVYWIDKYNGKY